MPEPSTDSRPIVTLRGVRVLYGSHPALRDLTVTFSQGATGLLGANGAGKTSLILALLGLIDLDAGAVEVLGTDVTANPLAVRARVGYAPERDAYIPELNAVASVAYCGELAGLPAETALERAHDVLTYVGLGESRYRAPDTYSAGMRQRLKLAQALVHDPELLILDEPTDGMDPRNRDQMLRLIADLASRYDRHLILSSHLLADVERVCDAFVLLDHGALAAAGGISDWRRGDRSRYEVGVKGNINAFIAALSAAQLPFHMSSNPPMLIVDVLHGGTRVLFAAARDAGVQIRHLRSQQPSLDDIVYDTIATAAAQEVRHVAR